MGAGQTCIDGGFRSRCRCAGSQFDPDIVPVFLGMDFSGYDHLLAQGIEASASDLRLVEDREEAA